MTVKEKDIQYKSLKTSIRKFRNSYHGKIPYYLCRMLICEIVTNEVPGGEDFGYERTKDEIMRLFKNHPHFIQDFSMSNQEAEERKVEYKESIERTLEL